MAHQFPASAEMQDPEHPDLNPTTGLRVAVPCGRVERGAATLIAELQQLPHVILRALGSVRLCIDSFFGGGMGGLEFG